MILKNCLCCDSSALTLILDLGNQPLANNLKSAPNEKYETYPLGINVCTECFHVQLTNAVDPKLLFSNYLYVSGTTLTLREYFEWFSKYVFEDCYPKNILDIGCNDGTQLDYFKSLGIDTYGVDPAENLAVISKEKGHTIFVDYFNEDFLLPSRFKFSAIVAQNVFAHNSDPYKFLINCEKLLADDGTLYIQTSQADMILNNEFDTIYHEHVSFFNINSMNELLHRTQKLYLIDVIKVPIHGNSYVFAIKKKPRNYYRIENLLKLEKVLGLHSLSTYRKFADNVNSIKQELENIIQLQINKGYKLIGYGAAAKGITVLHTFNLKPEYIIDDNKFKQGKYTQVSGIPIVSIDKLKEEEEDCHLLFLPLAWNFSEEIRARIKKARPHSESYDKFIYYFPEVICQ